MVCLLKLKLLIISFIVCYFLLHEKSNIFCEKKKEISEQYEHKCLLWKKKKELTGLKEKKLTKPALSLKMCNKKSFHLASTSKAGFTTQRLATPY